MEFIILPNDSSFFLSFEQRKKKKELNKNNCPCAVVFLEIASREQAALKTHVIKTLIFFK